MKSEDKSDRESGRQERIEELFEKALACQAEDREAFLSSECGEDDELRGCLENLLQSDEEAGSFLGRLVAEGGATEVTAEPSEGASPAGRRLGPYELLDQIGQGGMSTVFLANRVDGTFRRPVVVKVIRQGMESADALRRLRLERQILAGLEHPNIARLYDGGTTEDNLPYFVLELVDGVRIDEHCDRQRLPVEARLDLFRKVCAAVQYAHQNLVVHRDLKPGNILVTADHEPKLLDFGIAKLLESEPGVPPEEPTVAWARLMTPHYASPEQILGRRITTASDVYSLGVLLYKLLTGNLPRSLEGLSPLEIEAQMTSAPTTKPSEEVSPKSRVAGSTGSAGTSLGDSAEPNETTATVEDLAALRSARPEQLHKLLAGDLDLIVAKALHGDPERRYSSPEQLAEDLRRHQEGLPVLARPDTMMYRSGKFLRRHRMAVATAALVAMIVTFAAIALAIQSLQITRERDQLRAVLSFVKSVFNVAGEGEDLTVRQAVDRSSVALDRELGDQPEVYATLLDVTGTIYLDLQQTSQARAQLAKAVELRSRLLGEDSLAFAESLSTLGVADAFDDDYELGEQRAREAAAIFQQRLGEHHPDLVRPLNNLVDVLCYRGDYQSAEGPSTQALTLARDLLPEQRVEYADAVAFRALIFAKLGDQPAAEELYREALELHRRYRGEEHPRVATLLNNLALALKKQDKLGEAETSYRQALELERELFGADHPELALALNNLASLLRTKGDFEESEEAYREAVNLVRRVFGPGHSGTLITSTGLALVLIDTDRPQAAETLLREGLEVWSESLAGSWYPAYSRSVLGESLVRLGRLEEAKPLLVSAHEELQAALGNEAPKTRDARRRLEALAQGS
ncbi:MAG: serine/threonine-protein kinase [Deltaproteobacteria bacterium]|nr:serine/threonine-protein kinase [Deltaproteobacteria bacterium]